MSTQRDGVNPLRPYYIPPTIGEASDPVAAPFSGRHATAGARYASKARDVLADLDYNDYLKDSSPSAVQNLRELADELMWKYSSVLMAQPFEVAKTILQARNQDERAALVSAPEPSTLRRQASSRAGSVYHVALPPSPHPPRGPRMARPLTRSRTTTPTRMQTSRPTLPPTLPKPRRPRAAAGATAAAIRRRRRDSPP